MTEYTKPERMDRVVPEGYVFRDYRDSMRSGFRYYHPDHVGEEYDDLDRSMTPATIYYDSWVDGRYGIGRVTVRTHNLCAHHPTELVMVKRILEVREVPWIHLSTRVEHRAGMKGFFGEEFREKHLEKQRRMNEQREKREQGRTTQRGEGKIFSPYLPLFTTASTFRGESDWSQFKSW